MSEKKCFLAYGRGVTSIPEAGAEKIISGTATLTDIRVLTALCTSRELSGCNFSEVVVLLSEITGIVESKVENALSFWRGCGVLDYIETSDEATPETKPSKAKIKQNEKSAASYTGDQISEILGRDGGKLKNMLDQCQQLVGKMFNTVEVSVIVGLCDWLGLEPEFVVTMTAYYTNKKPGCNVRYLEKAALDLVNNGITTLSELDAYLKEMELYDGVAGKLRSLLGIGGRAYSKKENGMIKRWVKDFSYGEDIIRYAYEITVDNKGEFSFDYANRVLENWFKAGVKTKAEAENSVAQFKHEKESAKDGGSFDTDTFFKLAMKRSYGEIMSEDKK